MWPIYVRGLSFYSIYQGFFFFHFKKISCYIILYQLAYPGFYATRVLHVLLNPQMTHQDDFWYSVDNSRGFTFFIIEYSTTTIVFFLTFYLFFVRKLWFKINESLYIALFAVSESIKKLLSIHCVSIYLFSTFFSMDFTQWKSVGVPNTA